MISNREFSVQQATFKNGSSYKENQDSKSVWLKYPIIDTKDTDDIQITDNLVGFIGVYDGHDNIYGKITSKFAPLLSILFDAVIVALWSSTRFLTIFNPKPECCPNLSGLLL